VTEVIAAIALFAVKEIHHFCGKPEKIGELLHDGRPISG
jgi:hypothetical protein